jgi:outer membrane protein OmpA-like peptidoglycan-associated protein
LRKNGQTIEGGKSDKKGFAPNLELAPNDELDFLSEKEDYLTKRANFSMEGREIPQILLKKDLTDTTFTFQIVMDKPEIGKEITELFEINPIFYDLDKSDIRTDAAEELEKIVQFLKDNEYVSLELGSHTDSRASTAYNNKLSQRRAESAVKYITSRGIAAERMKAKGYGESQLINECADGVDCSEELHQQNRRTEFKIIQIKED